jgi:hypothetical protein
MSHWEFSTGPVQLQYQRPTACDALVLLGWHRPYTAEFVLRGWQPLLEDGRLLREDIYSCKPPALLHCATSRPRTHYLYFVISPGATPSITPPLLVR